MNEERLLAFIKERHSVYERRALGRPWPWTEDPILRKYRFCNVFRNLDEQTKLIHYHWLIPHSAEPDVWFAMVVARLINWWPTLASMGYPVPWQQPQKRRMWSAYCERLNAGEKVFTGAYMVRADAVISGSKLDYLMQHVMTPLWEARREVRPRAGDTLDAFHRRLMGYRDMGSFMAAQVVADVKYAAGPLRLASDWHTWAASGPGSQRGLNRVLGRPVKAAWGEAAWRDYFGVLHKEVTMALRAHPELGQITGQDLQNCLCEFDKYERVRLGEGRPRSQYQPPQP